MRVATPRLVRSLRVTSALSDLQVVAATKLQMEGSAPDF
jgi:hypothetical protein